jgi:hypothetical protein
MKIKGINNFSVEEFVPSEIWHHWKERSTLFINPQIMFLAQGIRNRYKKSVVINNWKWHTKGMYLYNYSGYRPPDCKTGSFLSRHKMGLCVDIKVSGMSAPEVQADIKTNYQTIFKPLGLTAIEADTPTWTHLSIEWTQSDKLWVIPKPKKQELKNGHH